MRIPLATFQRPLKNPPDLDAPACAGVCWIGVEGTLPAVLVRICVVVPVPRKDPMYFGSKMNPITTRTTKASIGIPNMVLLLLVLVSALRGLADCGNSTQQFAESAGSRNECLVPWVICYCTCCLGTQDCDWVDTQFFRHFL